MSKFMGFYAHVTGNEDAEKRLKALDEKIGLSQDQEAALDELIAFAKEEGFDFSKDEVKAFMEGVSAKGELSDEEMEAVAGGKVVGGCFIVGGGGGDFNCFMVGEGFDGGCMLLGIFPE